MKLSLYVTTALLALAISVPYASGAEVVGKAVRIVDSVQAKLGSASRVLAKSDPVHASERLSASSNSHGEFRLNDNSKIIVGPGSTISLDDFVVSRTGVSSGTLNVVKGAFRFASGRAKKGTYRIKTPLATIGIRGTRFDVYVKPNGETDVVHFSGRIEVCAGGNCRTMVSPCDVVRVKRGNSIRFLDYLRSGDRDEENASYNLTTGQNRFPPAWRAATAVCDRRALLDNADPNDEPAAQVDVGTRSDAEDEYEYSE